MRLSGFMFVLSAVLLSAGLTAAWSESIGVRNAGLAGSGAALVKNVDGVYGNPAGLAGLDQSCVMQVLNPSDGAENNFLSESLVLALRKLPCAGISLSLIDNKGLSAENISFSWFSAFKLLSIFSFGAGSEYTKSGDSLRLGGIMSVPIKSVLSRLGAGILAEDLDYEKFIHQKGRGNAVARLTLGGHVQLTFSDFLVSNLTMDTRIVDDHLSVRFENRALLAGLEQNLKFGRLNLVLRTGARFLKGEKSLLSAGMEAGLGFVSLGLAVRDSREGLRYHISAVCGLGSGLSAGEGNCPVVPPEKPVPPLIFANTREISASFTALQDSASGKLALRIEIPPRILIDYWFLYVTKAGAHRVVKSFDDWGMPPKGVFLAYDDLEDGTYRIDLTLIGGYGSRTMTREINFIKRSNTITFPGSD